MNVDIWYFQIVTLEYHGVFARNTPHTPSYRHSLLFPFGELFSIMEIIETIMYNYILWYQNYIRNKLRRQKNPDSLLACFEYDFPFNEGIRARDHHICLLGLLNSSYPAFSFHRRSFFLNLHWTTYHKATNSPQTNHQYV